MWLAPATELRGKTHCVRGHEYAVVGTYTKDDGWRRCAECRRIDNREAARRRRARIANEDCANEDAA